MSIEIYGYLVLAGLTTGAVYALIALGFVTIYRSSNILNLAQGEFVMLGALGTVFLLKTCGLPYPLAAVLSVSVVSLVGLLVYRCFIHPIRREPLLILIMITIGISFLLSGTAGVIFGPDPQSLPAFLPGDAIDLVGAIRVDRQTLMVLFITVCLLLLLFYLSRFTPLGKAMEAVSTDRLGADLSGIPGTRIIMAAFGISAAVGAVAGIAITPIFFTQYNSGAILGLKGFTAAVIGGWGKYSGAVLGGFLLGVTESVSIGFIPSGYRDAISFGILIAILYVRPKGILGSRALEESRK